MGNTFIVSQSGRAFMNFGDYKPGNSQGTGILGNGTPYASPGTYSAGVPMQEAQDVVGASVASQSVINPVVESQRVVDPVVESQDVFKPPYVPKSEYKDVTTRTITTDPDTGTVTDVTTTTPTLFPSIGPDGQPVYVPSADPSADPKLVPRYDSNGRPVYVPSTDPTAAPTLIPSYDSAGRPIYVPSTDPTAAPSLVPRYDSNGRPIYVPSSDPAAAPSLVPRYDKNGQPVYVSGQDPRRFKYPQNSLYGYLEAVIESSSAKTLASPTLLVQEGQKASVETGTSVITGVKATDTANGSTQFENTRENAGLTLDVSVEKIDDNGFVTMDISPSISIPEEAGFQEGIQIYNITGRSLSSGRVRLRDRQTLVLTGVIRESDVELITKWPILGDLPILGQLFRKSSSEKTKQELVILVTPSIVDDESGGAYGYGYRPSTREARQLMSPR
jgi:type IV pilus assembly protein PilQ